MQPETRYAKSGDVHIAYQVFGDGPINLVIAPFSCRTWSIFGTSQMHRAGYFVSAASRGW
jgi:hypothetical protein